MQPLRPPSTPVRFGPFEVDFAVGELRKRGRKVPLQDQPFKVLTLLLHRPGDLITREELQRALWHAAEIGKLYRAGVSKSEIARRLEIGRTSVRRVLGPKQ
jgi:DNA-binding response OmpR family regulator